MDKMLSKIFFSVLIIFIAENLFAGEPLKIYYFERVPYHFTDSNLNARGIIVERTIRICYKANIECRFFSIPTKRIFTYLKQKNLACSIGWYYTEKRSKIFKYTLPMFRSKAIVAVINKNKWTEDTYKCPIDKLFKSHLTLGLISGFKYGSIIEHKLVEYKNKINLMRFNVSIEKIIKLTAIGRVDYTFVSEDNVDYFLKTNKKMAKNLIIVHIKEIKQGKKRYMMCSKNISDRIIEKLNSAIKNLGYEE
jgi:polar amino acid transport system substrate-binding protein